LEKKQEEQSQATSRKAILDGTISAFNQKGIKFTMDDIARQLGMSKKTIYKVFADKEQLFLAMVDYLFDGIKESEQAVLEDENLDTLGKLHKILGVMPEGYKDVDFRQLYLLRDKYPTIYKQVEQRLETGWENTIALMEQGMEEGVLRKVRIPIVKMMLEAALEQFFQRDILIQNGITYQEALTQVVDILIMGIKA
jgi:AcrR family transcriptional regulator